MYTLRLPLIAMTIAAATGLFAVPDLAHADKLEGFDETMQVLDDPAALAKAAAYLKVPDAEDAEPTPEPVPIDEITDPADFSDDFEHDVEFEEELMQDEDDFEDGDDVDDDRIGTADGKPR